MQRDRERHLRRSGVPDPWGEAALSMGGFFAMGVEGVRVVPKHTLPSLKCREIA